MVVGRRLNVLYLWAPLPPRPGPRAQTPEGKRGAPRIPCSLARSGHALYTPRSIPFQKNNPTLTSSCASTDLTDEAPARCAARASRTEGSHCQRRLRRPQDHQTPSAQRVRRAPRARSAGQGRRRPGGVIAAESARGGCPRLGLCLGPVGGLGLTSLVGVGVRVRARARATAMARLRG